MFLQPIHVGELVTFLASVNYTGTSSMAIGIRVVTGNIQQRTQRHANSCYFTMVAVDANRKPQAVPPLLPETGEQQRRFAKAEERKRPRQALHGKKRRGRPASYGTGRMPFARTRAPACLIARRSERRASEIVS